LIVLEVAVDKTAIISKIYDAGVVAIMRADSSDLLIAAADAVLEGGVNAIEVTMTTPGAIDVVKQASEKYGDEVVFGVGSVLDAETSRAAILAGAQFVVAPALDFGTIEICLRYSIPVMPGAFTPTEVLKAWQAGADMVKVFPASFFGPAYMKAVKAPLPQVKLVPVGGVNLDNAAEFIRKGAEVLGVGSALINNQLLSEGKLDEISERARRFREEVEKGRSP
jgi:2-dehydro-3-deoxyphosphogluconate aldolase/(4S)-4-hydroxy-2-oxoglutarate aldolase